jgi:hypothetical protein
MESISLEIPTMGSGIRDEGTDGDGKVDLKHIITEMRKFGDGLQRLKNPSKIMHLVEDVKSINASLQLLRDVKDREWGLLGVGIAQQSKAMISSCTRAYDLFKTSLQSESDDGDIAWSSKILGNSKIKRFPRMQIKAMSEQLSNCTLTNNSIVSIVSIANL